MITLAGEPAFFRKLFVLTLGAGGRTAKAAIALIVNSHINKRVSLAPVSLICNLCV